MKAKHILLLIIFFLFISNQAYGLRFNGPSMLRQSDINLSLGTFIEHDGGFGMLLINDFGIVNKFGTVAKIGFIPVYQTNAASSFYFGLETKILIWERFGGTDRFAFVIGGHYLIEGGVPGIDLSINIGSRFFKFENYIGLDVDINFSEAGEVQYPIDFIVGAKFTPFNNKKHSIVIEVGIPIAYSYLWKLGFAIRLGF